MFSILNFLLPIFWILIVSFFTLIPFRIFSVFELPKENNILYQVNNVKGNYFKSHWQRNPPQHWAFGFKETLTGVKKWMSSMIFQLLISLWILRFLLSDTSRCAAQIKLIKLSLFLKMQASVLPKVWHQWQKNFTKIKNLRIIQKCGGFL